VSELDDQMKIAVAKIAHVSTIVGSPAKNIGYLVDEMVESHAELVEIEIKITLGDHNLGLFKLSTENTLQQFTNVVRALAERQNELNAAIVIKNTAVQELSRARASVEGQIRRNRAGVEGVPLNQLLTIIKGIDKEIERGEGAM